MSLLSKFKPKPQAYDLDAFLAPGDWFFCRRIEIPQDLESGEEEGFVLLELEALSPFPLDHLHYGYQLDATRRYAFVFAAYKRRFEGADIAGWRRLDAALPDFLIGLHADACSEEPLVLVSEHSYSIFRYDKLSSLPASFYAEARPAPEEDEAFDLVSDVAAFCDRAKTAIVKDNPRIWFVNTNPKWLGQTAWLEAEDPQGALAAKVSFTRAEIWKVDLRDPEMVEQAKKDERQNGILWKGVLGIAAAVALLLVSEIVWGGSAGYLALRRGMNSDREPAVRAFDSLQTTTNTLQNFRESNLTPFQMIETLLPYQSWPKVIYRKFETDGPDVLVIDARASNFTEVNEFKKRLERSEMVSSVALSNQQNNPSGSSFTTTIRFVPGVFLPAPEVASNE